MKGKLRILLYFLHFSLAQSCEGQVFNYFQCLKEYWNYRYHLVGDKINRTQHMPFDQGQTVINLSGQTVTIPDFLSPQGIGEPGMMVVGVGPGTSLPANNIYLYDVNFPTNYNPPYPDNNGTVLGWDPRNTDWTNICLTCSPIHNAGGWGVNGACSTQPVSSLDGLGGVVNFDDQTPASLATYIEVLASEWKLLHQNGQGTLKTEEELYDAINAINRLDHFTNAYFSDETLYADGFLYRYDATWDFALGDNFGPNELVSGSDCTGKPDGCTDGGYSMPNGYNSMMSQDEAYYLILAFRCVSDWVEDATPFSSEIRSLAIHETYLIGRWMQGPNGGWILRDPDGKKVCQGSDALAFSYPLAKALKKITGEPIFPDAQSNSAGLLAWAFDLYPAATTLNPNTPFSGTESGDNLSQAAHIGIAAGLWGNSHGAGKVGDKLDKGQPTGIGGHIISDSEPEVQLDLMNYLLNGGKLYNSQSYIEGILSNNPFYPCYPQPIHADYALQAKTELGWMLLFNLYVMEYGGTHFIDLSDGLEVNYCNLQKRYVLTDFPKTIGLVTWGSDAHPLNIEAADTLIIGAGNGLGDLTISPGCRLNFWAPHVNIQAGTYLNGTVTVSNKRMDCSNEGEFISTTAGTGGLLIAFHGEDSNDEDSFNLFSHDTLEYCLTEIKNMLNDPNLNIEVKQEIYDILKQVSAYNADSLFELNLVSNSFIITENNISLSVYPNPFIDRCIISFNLPQAGKVSVMLFDLTGKKVNSIIDNRDESMGEHKIEFDQNSLENGVYVLKLFDSNGNILSKKIVIQ